MPDDFVPTSRSRARRVHERARYDRETVHALLDAGVLGHVGYVIDDQPYVTPTLYWRDGDRLYWHGSSASRMLRTVSQGIPACLTASHLDGLVVARSGFHCSVNYRSVMAFGRAHAVSEPDAHLQALHRFLEHVLPGHWAQMRPPSAQELKATTVVSMEIEEASAKIRTGPPKDDEPDYDLSCWAGVVPVRTVVGEPIPDPRLKPGIAPPGYLAAARLG